MASLASYKKGETPLHFHPFTLTSRDKKTSISTSKSIFSLTLLCRLHVNKSSLSLFTFFFFFLPFIILFVLFGSLGFQVMGRFAKLVNTEEKIA
jgi:hypothetical protein